MKQGKYLIIYVEDSPSAREMVADGFKDSGYLLETAAGVHDLEKRLLKSADSRKQVDLFIFDFHMPDITGAQIASVMDRVYHELKAVPFVIFSGRPREEVTKGIEAAKKSRTFAQNFRGYIEKKGDSVDDLISQIKKILP